MAKRFTDTNKWKKPFIRGLSGPYKLLWMYLCDDCDHAGIWQVDFEMARFIIGEKVNLETAKKAFTDKIIEVENGTKWFIPSFIEFQYPAGLNQQNNAHSSVISQLKKYNLLDIENKIKPLNSPLIGAKDGALDKDMDKDMDMDMDMDKAKKPKSEKTIFRMSNLFDRTEFDKAFAVWPKAKRDHYFEEAITWSDDHQKDDDKSVDWKRRIESWDRRIPWKGEVKPAYNSGASASIMPNGPYRPAKPQ